MSVDGAVLFRLENHAGLSALIGTRSFADRLPQGPVLPAVVFQRISTVRQRAMGSDPGIVMTRWQLSCWDSGKAGTKAVSAQVIAAFNRWRDTQDGTQIDDTFIDGELDDFEPDVGEIGFHRSLVDVIVHHRE